MSSITPQTSVDLARAAKEKGIRVLDAPVSGGEAGAVEAVLSIMVGGEQADFDEAEPLFEALGRTIVLCGPHGAGQTVKAANQLIVAVTLPTLVRDLGATTSQLQWIVDAYILVFAVLLLAAGSLADRFGRRRVLIVGLAWFAAASAAASLCTTPGQLIAARAVMGVGAGPCIVPAVFSAPILKSNIRLALAEFETTVLFVPETRRPAPEVPSLLVLFPVKLLPSILFRTPETVAPVS